MRRRIISVILITCILIGIINIAPLETNAANPDYSSIFVASYYASKYPDLKAAGITTESALLNHFVTSGMKEGRQGSEEFNVYVYMNNYPDLKAAFGNDLPKYYLHYMNAGKAEGRVARGNATAPATTTTVPATPTVNSGALHTAPAYPVIDSANKAVSSYKVGDTIVNLQGRTYKVTQNDINRWNYNPYGLTSGTSAITGPASIGDVRYINYSLAERYTGRQAHSVKMECYAINKNGVPLFRRYGSSYNVYTQAKNLVPAIDAITPQMSASDANVTIAQTVPQNVSSCTAMANNVGACCGQFLLEAYQLVSDAKNHQECLIYAGNGMFYFGSNNSLCAPGQGNLATFYVSFSSQK